MRARAAAKSLLHAVGSHTVPMERDAPHAAAATGRVRRESGERRAAQGNPER